MSGDKNTLAWCLSHAAPQAVTDFTLTNDDMDIILTWTPPSDRNGTFDYIITFSARSSFNYPNHLDRTEVASDDDIMVVGTSTSHTLENVLAYANYQVTITAFNRLRGMGFSGPIVTSNLRSLAQGELELFVSQVLPCIVHTCTVHIEPPLCRCTNPKHSAEFICAYVCICMLITYILIPTMFWIFFCCIHVLLYLFYICCIHVLLYFFYIS